MSTIKQPNKSPSNTQIALSKRPKSQADVNKFRMKRLMGRNLKPGQFGTDSPKWTIPGSRHEEKVKESCPGPDAYSTFQPSIKLPTPILIHNRFDLKNELLTKNIEFPNISCFPEKKVVNIGNQTGVHFYSNAPKTPGPSYVPTNLPLRKKILSRFPPSKDSGIPGPGAYSPNDPHLERSKSYVFGKNVNQELFGLEKKCSTPGPGSYNIEKPLQPPQKWTAKLRIIPDYLKEKALQHERPWEPHKD